MTIRFASQTKFPAYTGSIRKPTDTARRVQPCSAPFAPYMQDKRRDDRASLSARARVLAPAYETESL